jgi:hypothetical protein
MEREYNTSENSSVEMTPNDGVASGDYDQSSENTGIDGKVFTGHSVNYTFTTDNPIIYGLGMYGVLALFFAVGYFVLTLEDFSGIFVCGVSLLGAYIVTRDMIKRAKEKKEKDTAVTDCPAE